jgi:hypothetical protein
VKKFFQVLTLAATLATILSASTQARADGTGPWPKSKMSLSSVY